MRHTLRSRIRIGIFTVARLGRDSSGRRGSKRMGAKLGRGRGRLISAQLIGDDGNAVWTGILAAKGVQLRRRRKIRESRRIFRHRGSFALAP